MAAEEKGGDSGADEGFRRRSYCREELLAVRFDNEEWQLRFWNSVYHGLEEALAHHELDELFLSSSSSSHQMKRSRRKQRSQKKKKAAADVADLFGEIQMPAMSQCEVTENLEEVYRDSNPDAVCSELFMPHGNCNLIQVEEEEEEDWCENSDDEYDSLRRPAFYVEGEPDFKSGPPQDGFEFLRRVRWETEHVPKVVVVKLDESKLKMEQTPYMPHIPDIPDCPLHLLPSKRWVDSFLDDFVKLRKAISQLGCPDQSPVDMTKSSAGKLVKQYLLSGDLSGKLPLLSMLLKLESVSRAVLLRKHAAKLEAAAEISRSEFEWAFSLCVAVDEPLDADTTAAIRSLFRNCANLRAAKKEYDDELVMLNIIITIAGKYFGQAEK